MRRIGFRRLLPPVQLVLFGTLIWFADREEQRQLPCSVAWVPLAPTVYAQDQADVGFDDSCRRPLAESIAVDLNLPAVFAGALAAVALRHDTDRAVYGASAPAVLILWYLVGLWIDRRLGYVAGPLRRRRYPLLLLKAALGFCLLLFLLSDAGWVFHPVSGMMGLIAWSGFFFAVVWSNQHRVLPTLFPDGRKDVAG